MSDCQLCDENEVCPGEHCLVELSDITSFLRSKGTEWNEHPVLQTPNAREHQRYAGRMLHSIAAELEAKYLPGSPARTNEERNHTMRLPIRIAGHSTIEALVIDSAIASTGSMERGFGAYLGNFEPYECSRSEPAGFVMSWEDFEQAYFEVKKARDAWLAREVSSGETKGPAR